MQLDFIEASILRLCRQPRTFGYITQHLQGFDPVQINKVLSALKDKNVLQQKQDLWSIHEGPAPLSLNLIPEDPLLYLKKYMGYFEFLKNPHPLDFEWRNSTASLNYLAQLLQEKNQISDSILLLGMPTLFATACIKDIPQKVTLVERNNPIIKGLAGLCGGRERFRLIEGDIFTIAPDQIGRHQTIVMDPPWYSKHFFQFLWLAAKCVSIGGHVAISLPPFNTRPSVGQERLEWFNFCLQQGLSLESLYSQKLSYSMPFFEFNAFRSAGIESMSPFWRKGDLAVMRKVSMDATERPINDSGTDVWVEKDIDGVRIRVKKISQESIVSGELSITHLVKGDILPTVSNRDERRLKANVWTSGNRVYTVNDPEKLIALLQLGANETPSPIDTAVVEFFQGIVDLEKKEYNEYMTWLYHEMEGVQ